MTTNEYNSYIKNYLENDKTQSAIMLTAPWGTGKSYYIRNDLSRFLEENKLSYAIVSAYGLSSIADINKELFLEIKFQKTKKQCKWLATFGKTIATGAVGIGKTLLKNIAHIDIDFDLSEPNYKKLYDLVNLKDKLIIFEDIERSSVDIIEFLGYVNSLVEQDGVKVLLVANEQEFLKTIDSDSQLSNQRDKNKEPSYTPRSIEYLRKKEKTISDTIIFETDKKEALRSIIKLFFPGKLLETLITEENIVDIINVMSIVKSDNLRAVMFACQKTSDIIKVFDGELDHNFVGFLLCSIIAYSCRTKSGKNTKWKNDEISPSELGTATFPLYRVCYDYINSQLLNSTKLAEAQESYSRQKKFESDKNEFNKYFVELKRFYDNTETNVSSAVAGIKELLSKNEGVEVSEYGMLANYLIAVRECITNEPDVDECKRLMLKNVQGIGSNSNIEHDLMYHNGVELETADQRKELAEFKKELLESIKSKKKEELFTMDNSDKKVENFIDYAYSHKDEIIGNGSFVREINIQNFVDFLKNCTAQEIGDIRGVFLSIYASVNIGEFMSGDKENLELLKDELQKLKKNYTGFDKIQRKQIEWFIGNLEEIIQKLS
ncbi:MAG: P-loop NTPase fold protein [Christensenellaceae bacterium]